MRRRLPVSAARAIGALACALACAPAVGQTTLDLTHFLNYGLEAAAEIESTLRVTGTALYAESATLNGNQFGGSGGRAFAWPLSAQFRVLNSLTRYDPATYESQLRAFSDEFHAGYWENVDRGYSALINDNDRYYDDNAHIAVALAEAYEITGDAAYLQRARQTYQFLLMGEAPGHPGGSYWRVGDVSFLDTAAVLQGARAGAMLYRATGNAVYLDDALQRYEWAATTTQLADGTFMEKLFLTGPQAGTIGNFPLVNFAAMGIEANLQFFDATGDIQYLQEAQRIGIGSARYFDSSTGALNDEGYWAYEMVDAYVDLYERDGRPTWLVRVQRALDWLHDSEQDPEGHYPRLWGRDDEVPGEVYVDGVLQAWHLNDMAPVARAYLHTALLQTDPISGQNGADFDGSGTVDGGDFLLWQRGLGLTAQTDGTHGDANGDGRVNGADLASWESAFGTSGAAAASSHVPEPASAALATLALLSLASWRRRRD